MTETTLLSLPVELIRAIFQHRPAFCNALILNKTLYAIVLSVLYTDVVFHADRLPAFISALQHNAPAARALRHLTILPCTSSAIRNSIFGRNGAFHCLGTLPQEACTNLCSLTIRDLNDMETSIPALPNLRQLALGFLKEFSDVMPLFNSGLHKLEFMQLREVPIPQWITTNNQLVLKSLVLNASPAPSSLVEKRHFRPSESLLNSLRHLSLNFQLLRNVDELSRILLSLRNLIELSLSEVENFALPVLSDLRCLCIRQPRRRLDLGVSLDQVIPELGKFKSLETLTIYFFVINSQLSRPKTPYEFSLSKLNLTFCTLSDSLAVDMLLRATTQLRMEDCSIRLSLSPLPNIQVLEYTGSTRCFNAIKDAVTKLRALEVSTFSPFEEYCDMCLSIPTLEVLKIWGTAHASLGRARTLRKCLADGKLGRLEHVILHAQVPKNTFDATIEWLQDSGVKVNERTWGVAKNIVLSETSRVNKTKTIQLL